jgi:hypothetical protein
MGKSPADEGNALLSIGFSLFFNVLLGSAVVITSNRGSLLA